MSNYCHFCRYCFGECRKHERIRGGYPEYESEYPDKTCADFRPDYERSDANPYSSLDGCCATCKFYSGYCYLSETVKYNDDRVCDRFDVYRDTDW